MSHFIYIISSRYTKEHENKYVHTLKKNTKRIKLKIKYEPKQHKNHTQTEKTNLEDKKRNGNVINTKQFPTKGQSFSE